MDLLVIPAKVQGPGAADDIVRGIRIAPNCAPNSMCWWSVAAVGSLEDLCALTKKSSCALQAASPIPTISAVGHEVDVTLSDLVADARRAHADQRRISGIGPVPAKLPAISPRLKCA